MIKVLEGQISFGGMQDALDAVVRYKNIKHGVLKVTSNTCSGLIGVFCGRFITGAILTLSGEAGLPALRQLLSAKDGNFALLDVTDEPVADLNQSLGVDLQAVLAAVDFSLEFVPVSEAALIGLAVPSEEIRTIDTSIETDPVPIEQLTPERIDQTYQRIQKLSDHLKAQQESQAAMDASWGNAPPAPPLSDAPSRSENQFYDQPPEWERKNRNGMPTSVEIGTGEMPYESLGQPMPAITNQASPMPVANRPREERHSDTGNYAVVYDAAPPTERRFKSNDEFKRLKDWKTKSQIIVMVLWILVFGGIIYALYTYGPQLAHIVAGVLPKHK
jgi:hypothetical protein